MNGGKKVECPLFWHSKLEDVSEALSGRTSGQPGRVLLWCEEYLGADSLTGRLRLQSIDRTYPVNSGPTPAGIDQYGMDPLQDAFTLCRVFS
jgi:hypothetical protein